MISFKDFFYNISFFYEQLNIEQKQFIDNLFLDKDFSFSLFNEEEWSFFAWEFFNSIF